MAKKTIRKWLGQTDGYISVRMGKTQDRWMDVRIHDGHQIIDFYHDESGHLSEYENGYEALRTLHRVLGEILDSYDKLL